MGFSLCLGHTVKARERTGEQESVESGTGCQLFRSSSLPTCMLFMCVHKHTNAQTALPPLLILQGTQNVGDPSASEMQTLSRVAAPVQGS